MESAEQQEEEEKEEHPVKATHLLLRTLTGRLTLGAAAASGTWVPGAGLGALLLGTRKLEQEAEAASGSRPQSSAPGGNAKRQALSSPLLSLKECGARLRMRSPRPRPFL